MAKQKGFVAVLLIVVMAMAAAAALTKGLFLRGEADLKERQITRQRLQEAKQALLTYIAVGNTASDADLLNDRNGLLPCPDLIGDGNSVAACGTGGTTAAETGAGIHSLGLLPYRTLGSKKLLDANEECLWYAVSGDFKNGGIGGTTSPINSDSLGAFTIIQPVKTRNMTTGAITWSENVLAGGIDPLQQGQRAVAVIFSPGSAARTQTRTAATGANTPQSCTLPVKRDGAPNAEVSAVKYLESYIGTTISGNNNAIAAPTNGAQTFVQADSDHEKLNDELIWITADEFALAISKRTARIMASAIRNFYARNLIYPTAAAVPGGACVEGLLKGFAPLTCNGVPFQPPVRGADADGCDLTFPDQPDAPQAMLNMGRRLNARLTPSTAMGRPCTVAQWPANQDAWFNQTHYAVSPRCLMIIDGVGCAGLGAELTVDGTAVGALLMLRGRDPSTPRTCTPPAPAAATQATLANCISIPNQILVTSAGLAYSTPNSATSNDVLISLPR